MDDFSRAIERIIAGLEKRNRLLNEHERAVTAYHEMGHALGLPHSDNERDLMYPENTAWRPTARDYRTMEAVYRVANGALIRR